MKSSKSKARVRKPTVPKDVQAVITEDFAGHEKLYDAIAQLWERTGNRIFKLPDPDRFCNRNMFVAIHEKMREALYEGVKKARERRDEKIYARPKPK